MDKKKYFFKIIIPNFNNYIYIKKCLDSVLNQTFTDWHCIIVDDLSTDKSDRIAEIYTKRYPDKFTFLRMEEKGYAGAARNLGLKQNIFSEYTIFLDSDDWFYNNESLNQLFNNTKNYPDIIISNFYTLKEQKLKEYKHIKNIKDVLFNGVQPYKFCIKSIFDYVKFKENRSKNNDMIWGVRLFDVIDDKNVVYLDTPIIVYNQDSINSCQNSTNKNNIIHIESQYNLIDDLLKETYKKNYCLEFKDKTIENYQKMFQNFSTKIDINKLFENSFVISIDDEKLKKFYKIFSKQFKNIQLPKHFNGSRDKRLTSVQNCTRSHLNIIKKAKSLNLPYVMIFEDDAYPCNNINTLFQKYLQFIPPNIKLLLLGWSNHSQLKQFYRKPQSFDKHINKIETIISGSHSYIIFKSGYDEYINYINKTINATADCQIFYNLQPGYILNKPLFIQYSDKKSMNGHIGYIYYGDNIKPPENFPEISFYNL